MSNLFRCNGDYADGAAAPARRRGSGILNAGERNRTVDLRAGRAGLATKTPGQRLNIVVQVEFLWGFRPLARCREHL